MRVAVTYENGEVFQHFGHTAQFKLYDISGGKVTNSEIVDTNGSGHGALAKFLAEHRVEVLICGGIGAGAQQALANEEIRLFGGVTGEADKVVDDLIMGRLKFNPQALCNHHHGEEHHDCSDHGCGGHNCSH